jgi:hypothetical protein
MKKIFLILGLLATSMALHADTLDYWTVYLNDSVIGQFNAGSEDLSIGIDHSSIKDTDVLSIRYLDDTPCVECGCILIVRDQRKKTLTPGPLNDYGEKMSVRLRDMVSPASDEVWHGNEGERFELYYQEMSSSGAGPMVLVLQMWVK